MTELTAREIEVRDLAAQGLSNDAIADRLAIRRRTVETHMHTVFRKTGVRRRSELADGTGAAPADPHDQDRLDRYDAVLRRLVGRHLTLFKERVEITFTVGDQDEQDRVTERRWTTPEPYVVYRTSRPIVTEAWEEGLDPDGLELACAVVGRDVHVDLFAVVEPDSRPLAVAVFQPGLAEETEWRLDYRSTGLWAPLRAGGADRFGWSTATSEPAPGARPDTVTVSEITFRLVFPAGWTDVGLVERTGAGTVSGAGPRELRWTDTAPSAGKYEFGVTGRPAGS
jgi:DNA-binding CsgD family transcriptional regulator